MIMWANVMGTYCPDINDAMTAAVSPDNYSIHCPHSNRTMFDAGSVYEFFALWQEIDRVNGPSHAEKSHLRLNSTYDSVYNPRHGASHLRV